MFQIKRLYYHTDDINQNETYRLSSTRTSEGKLLQHISELYCKLGWGGRVNRAGVDSAITRVCV